MKGHDIKYSLLEIDVESHKHTLPRIIKHIICVPPVPMKLLQEISEFKESLVCLDEQVLSQLIRDSKDLSTLSMPINISRYENEVLVNTQTG